MVPGITFHYEGADSVGDCKADKLVYLTTVGGFINKSNYGANYIKAIARMLGISEFENYSIEGLDIDPEQREKILEEGINRIVNQVKKNN